MLLSPPSCSWAQLPELGSSWGSWRRSWNSLQVMLNHQGLFAGICSSQALTHITAPAKLLFRKQSITFVRNYFFSQGHLSFQSPRELGINCSSPSAADPSACLKCGRLQNKKHHLLNEAKHHNRFNDVDLSPNSCFEITTNH